MTDYRTVLVMSLITLYVVNLSAEKGYYRGYNAANAYQERERQERREEKIAVILKNASGSRVEARLVWQDKGISGLEEFSPLAKDPSIISLETQRYIVEGSLLVIKCNGWEYEYAPNPELLKRGGILIFSIKNGQPRLTAESVIEHYGISTSEGKGA